MTTPGAFIPGPDLAAKLAVIDDQRVAIDRVRLLRADLWPLVLDKIKLQWTTESNAIEGSTLTFGETKFFIEQGLTVEGKPLKDFLDARNHWEAIDLLFDVVAARRPVTPGLLQELNALILRGVEATVARNPGGAMTAKPASPGAYKSQPNHVLQADGTIHRYVEPLQVAAEVEQLCARIEAPHDLHPVVLAALSHYDFVRIHPFDDGNGRGARILMNLLLLRAGFPPAVVPLSSRRSYYAALADADHGRPLPFITLIADCVHDTQAQILSDLVR
ncbi:MAG: Fic family protein [Hyphomicrobiaceae bacterium]